MYKCVACSRVFDKGAYIIPPDKVYCPDCAEKLNNILDEFEIEFLKAKLYNKPLPNIDEHINKHSKTIEELKISGKWIILNVLRRCAMHDKTIL